MRKSLALMMTLALVLAAASVASAQSYSVFGNVGYGSLGTSTKIDRDSTLEMSGSGMALQIGGMYDVNENLAVGVLYDRVAVHSGYQGSALSSSDVTFPDVTFSDVTLTSLTASSVLSGFNAIVSYKFDNPIVRFDVFGGVGSYGFSSKYGFSGKLSEQGQDPVSFRGEVNSNIADRALGFIGGARVEAPLTSDLVLTGTFAYRSVNWGRTTLEVDYTISNDADKVSESSTQNLESFSAGGWSIGVGVTYKF